MLDNYDDIMSPSELAEVLYIGRNRCTKSKSATHFLNFFWIFSVHHRRLLFLHRFVFGRAEKEKAGKLIPRFIVAF